MAQRTKPQDSDSGQVDRDDIEAMPTAQAETSFVLSRFEVYNWGPFRGMHRAEFDPRGTAIIGPTGSGKTTLVDALMTLLVAQPRYNLASTGGHESDRTLIEYVRGVLGGDGADGRQEVARPGKTISGICATYVGGKQQVKLAGIFWTEGTGNAADDLKRRWVFSMAPDQSFDAWLRMLHEDGVRDLLKMGRETANLRFFESKRSYLERIRKFFDVSENAFTLLNRAAGLKQLNSIDEIFRELVLDDRSAFDRALEVASEFDNLSDIHAELQLAQRQQESLLPVQEEHDRLLKSQRKTQKLQILKRVLPIWFARISQEKWAQESQRLTAQIEQSQSALLDLEQKASVAGAKVDSLRERYLELGGNIIGELENTIAAQRKLVEERKKQAAVYCQMVARFGLNDSLDENNLRANQTELQKQQQTLSADYQAQESETLQAMSLQSGHQQLVEELTEAIRKVKQRPGSNIPPHFQDFRSELAQQISLRDSDLPFLAELIEVKATESNWRGAIEERWVPNGSGSWSPRSVSRKPCDGSTIETTVCTCGLCRLSRAPSRSICSRTVTSKSSTSSPMR
ncbi:MAG: ATP-binding protein [Planctomycetota bacterium]